VVAFAAGCASGPLSRVARAPSPYEQYATTLTETGLGATALGRDWAQAGEAALQQPVAVSSPFRETGYFPPERPAAAAFRLDLQRGRRLDLTIVFHGETAARLFVDVFETRDDGGVERVAWLPADATTLTYDVQRDATFVIRVQPELLRGGRFTIEHRTLASLGFPVSGLGAGAVQSEFGATREAGRRAHEGIDIFAPRGTPVVAVAAGVARASTNGLGGNVVWVQDARQRRMLYYAHLDRWAFEGTRTVQPGDVLGYVGNTGNARTTPPHLHFGIYADGAIDPLPFLAADDPAPGPVRASLEPLGQRVRIAQTRVSLRNGMGAPAVVSRELPLASLADVVGVSSNMYRVHLPDGVQGYVTATAVARADTAWRRARVGAGAGAAMLARPSPKAPIVDVLDSPTEVDVLGVFDDYTLVRTPSGMQGWIAGTVPATRTGRRSR